jgi:hypothetical protein
MVPWEGEEPVAEVRKGREWEEVDFTENAVVVEIRILPWTLKL